MKFSRENRRIILLILRSWLYYILRVVFSRPAVYLPKIVNDTRNSLPLTIEEWVKVKKVVKGIRRLSPLFIKNRRCLMEALIAYETLRMEGIQSQFHLGAKKEKLSVSTHAWVSVEGRTIIGGPKAEYVELIRTRKNYK